MEEVSGRDAGTLGERCARRGRKEGRKCTVGREERQQEEAGRKKGRSEERCEETEGSAREGRMGERWRSGEERMREERSRFMDKVRKRGKMDEGQGYM